MDDFLVIDFASEDFFDFAALRTTDFSDFIEREIDDSAGEFLALAIDNADRISAVEGAGQSQHTAWQQAFVLLGDCILGAGINNQATGRFGKARRTLPCMQAVLACRRNRVPTSSPSMTFCRLLKSFPLAINKASPLRLTICAARNLVIMPPTEY